MFYSPFYEPVMSITGQKLELFNSDLVIRPAVQKVRKSKNFAKGIPKQCQKQVHIL